MHKCEHQNYQFHSYMHLFISRIILDLILLSRNIYIPVHLINEIIYSISAYYYVINNLKLIGNKYVIESKF